MASISLYIIATRRKISMVPFASAEISFLKTRISFISLSVPTVRILVDGYSLLHSCPEIAPGKPRHSEAARGELIFLLTQYHDAIGTPITIVFDGGGAPPGTPKTISTPEVEVLFSKAGQTADDIIERAAHRFKPYGEVLVVTNDFAERETVQAFGGLASTCEHFMREIETTLTRLGREIKQRNRREASQYKNRK